MGTNGQGSSARRQRGVTLDASELQNREYAQNVDDDVQQQQQEQQMQMAAMFAQHYFAQAQQQQQQMQMAQLPKKQRGFHQLQQNQYQQQHHGYMHSSPTLSSSWSHTPTFWGPTQRQSQPLQQSPPSHVFVGGVPITNQPGGSQYAPTYAPTTPERRRTHIQQASPASPGENDQQEEEETFSMDL